MRVNAIITLKLKINSNTELEVQGAWPTSSPVCCGKQKQPVEWLQGAPAVEFESFQRLGTHSQFLCYAIQMSKKIEKTIL